MKLKNTDDPMEISIQVHKIFGDEIFKLLDENPELSQSYIIHALANILSCLVVESTDISEKSFLLMMNSYYQKAIERKEKIDEEENNEP